MGVLLSRGCWGNYLPGCTCGSVCQSGRVPVLMFVRCAWDYRAGFFWASHPASWCCGPKQDEMHMHSTLYTSSRLCDLYVPTKHTETYTHIHSLSPSFPYTPELREGIWEFKRRSVAGGWSWGATMGPNGTKPHSLLLHVENGRRARGGGEGGKKSGGKRRREWQLVGSANHQGNTHLIDMWNLNLSDKSIGTKIMDQSSKVCLMEAKEGKRQLSAEAKLFVTSSSVVGREGCPQGDYNPLCLWPFWISNSTAARKHNTQQIHTIARVLCVCVCCFQQKAE